MALRCSVSSGFDEREWKKVPVVILWMCQFSVSQFCVDYLGNQIRKTDVSGVSELHTYLLLWTIVLTDALKPDSQSPVSSLSAKIQIVGKCQLKIPSWRQHKHLKDRLIQPSKYLPDVLPGCLFITQSFVFYSGFIFFSVGCMWTNVCKKKKKKKKNALVTICAVNAHAWMHPLCLFKVGKVEPNLFIQM